MIKRANKVLKSGEHWFGGDNYSKWSKYFLTDFSKGRSTRDTLDMGKVCLAPKKDKYVWQAFFANHGDETLIYGSWYFGDCKIADRGAG